MKTKVRLFVILLSILFIIFGIYRNEVATIFIKAINICMECIGLG